jgi:hypothetical protein
VPTLPALTLPALSGALLAALLTGCAAQPVAVAVAPPATFATAEAQPGALLYDLDPYTATASQVERLQRGGHRVLCRLAVGVGEADRPDADRIPARLRGAATPDGRGQWLDIRDRDGLSPVLLDRLRLCRTKGFDALDATAVDSYRQPTGFPLRQADQLAFDRLVLALARSLGLGAVLRVPVADAPALGADLDFTVDAGCPAGQLGCLGLSALAVTAMPAYVALLGT